MQTFMRNSTFQTNTLKRLLNGTELHIITIQIMNEKKKEPFHSKKIAKTYHQAGIAEDQQKSQLHDVSRIQVIVYEN